MSKGKITIVGIGPGDISFLTIRALEEIKKSDFILGNKRQVTPFYQYLPEEKIIINEKFIGILDILQEKTDYNIVVLASGDTGFYSLLNYVKENLKDKEREIEVIPGISSFQYLFSRLKLTWHDYFLTSIHGRGDDFISLLKISKKGVVLLTEPSKDRGEVLESVLKSGINNINVIVGENLSYENEKIYSFHINQYKNFILNEPVPTVLILQKEE